jgi:ATP-dependent Clp protease protease subunit
MRLTKEYKQHLLEQGVDIDLKRIYICEDIKRSTFVKMDKALCVFESLKVKNVDIVINSVGGSSYDGLAIADRIRTAKVPTTTIAMGAAMSAALLILVSGGRRIATKRTWILHHAASYGEEGSHRDIKQSVQQSEREEVQAAELMAECTSKDYDFWKKMADSKELYLTAEEAWQLGVIDEIR